MRNIFSAVLVFVAAVAFSQNASAERLYFAFGGGGVNLNPDIFDAVLEGALTNDPAQVALIEQAIVEAKEAFEDNQWGIRAAIGTEWRIQNLAVKPEFELSYFRGTSDVAGQNARNQTITGLINFQVPLIGKDSVLDASKVCENCNLFFKGGIGQANINQEFFAQDQLLNAENWNWAWHYGGGAEIGLGWAGLDDWRAQLNYRRFIVADIEINGLAASVPYTATEKLRTTQLFFQIEIPLN